MTIRLHATIVVIAAACLASAAPAQEHNSMRVSTRGIAFDTPAGLAELTRRVRVSARVACDNGGTDLASQIAARTCQADLEQAGAAQVAALSANRGITIANR